MKDAKIFSLVVIAIMSILIDIGTLSELGAYKRYAVSAQSIAATAKLKVDSLDQRLEILDDHYNKLELEYVKTNRKAILARWKKVQHIK